MPAYPKYTGCLVGDCDNDHYAKQYCRKHYHRLRRTGDPLGVFEPKRKNKPKCECGEEAFARGMCRKHYGSWYYYNRLGNSQGDSWKKEEVTYAGAHARVRAIRGRAVLYACVSCGSQAEHWALREGVDDDNIRYGDGGRRPNMPYSIQPSDYQPMCRPCHDEYDSAGPVCTICGEKSVGQQLCMRHYNEMYRRQRSTRL